MQKRRHAQRVLGVHVTPAAAAASAPMTAAAPGRLRTLQQPTPITGPSATGPRDSSANADLGDAQSEQRRPQSRTGPAAELRQSPAQAVPSSVNALRPFRRREEDCVKPSARVPSASRRASRSRPQRRAAAPAEFRQCPAQAVPSAARRASSRRGYHRRRQKSPHLSGDCSAGGQPRAERAALGDQGGPHHVRCGSSVVTCGSSLPRRQGVALYYNLRT